MSEQETRREGQPEPRGPEPPGQTEKEYPIPPTIRYDLGNKKND